MNEYNIVGDPDGPQRSRYGSPTFYNFLAEMAETHDAKSHDYAPSDSPFANYEFAGILASMFSYSAIDSGFAGRLGEKLYRIYVLESGGKIPKNESLADTERDIAVIATLWMAARRENRQIETNKRNLEQEREAAILSEKLKYQGIQPMNAPMDGLRWDKEVEEIQKAVETDLRSIPTAEECSTISLTTIINEEKDLTNEDLDQVIKYLSTVKQARSFLPSSHRTSK